MSWSPSDHVANTQTTCLVCCDCDRGCGGDVDARMTADSVRGSATGWQTRGLRRRGPAGFRVPRKMMVKINWASDQPGSLRSRIQYAECVDSFWGWKRKDVDESQVDATVPMKNTRRGRKGPAESRLQLSMNNPNPRTLEGNDLVGLHNLNLKTCVICLQGRCTDKRDRDLYFTEYRAGGHGQIEIWEFWRQVPCRRIRKVKGLKWGRARVLKQ